MDGVLGTAGLGEVAGSGDDDRISYVYRIVKGGAEGPVTEVHAEGAAGRLGNVDDGSACIGCHSDGLCQSDHVARVTFRTLLVVLAQLGWHVPGRVGEDSIVPGGLSDGEDAYAGGHTGETIVGGLGS